MEPEKLLPPGEPMQQVGVPSAKSDLVLGKPSQKQQSWGVVISIIIIVLMIIVGAFYAWGQRIAQNQVPAATAQ